MKMRNARERFNGKKGARRFLDRKSKTKTSKLSSTSQTFYLFFLSFPLFSFSCLPPPLPP
jgi:hypothetical protein